jgi:hypothetical protein
VLKREAWKRFGEFARFNALTVPRLNASNRHCVEAAVYDQLRPGDKAARVRRQQ